MQRVAAPILDDANGLDENATPRRSADNLLKVGFEIGERHGLEIIDVLHPDGTAPKDAKVRLTARKWGWQTGAHVDASTGNIIAILPGQTWIEMPREGDAVLR